MYVFHNKWNFNSCLCIEIIAQAAKYLKILANHKRTYKKGDG